MLVPLIVLVAESPELHADVMPCPGANQSTHVPQFEKPAFPSLEVLAALVIASGTRAGLNWQAEALELPAATAYATPSAIEFLTARSTAMLAPPPRLMFATAGSPGWCAAVTKSIPAMISDHSPEPPQSSTRTATRSTSLATP